MIHHQVREPKLAEKNGQEYPPSQLLMTYLKVDFSVSVSNNVTEYLSLLKIESLVAETSTSVYTVV